MRDSGASLVVEAIQFVRSKRAYVIAYVVMPDHLHALLVPREGTWISRLMQSIKGCTARLVNERLDRRGPLWQRSFFGRMIRDERQLLETVNYVHMNPVIAGLADQPDAYPYSSAGRDDLVDLGPYLGDELTSERPGNVVPGRRPRLESLGYG